MACLTPQARPTTGEAVVAGSAPSVARFAALQYRNFRLIWMGQIVSNVGTWMQGVGTGWLVLQMKNSPFWLGLLGLSFAVPMIVLPLIGGAVVDRVDRIRLLYVTQSLQMVNALVLALATWAGVVGTERRWRMIEGISHRCATGERWKREEDCFLR